MKGKVGNIILCVFMCMCLYMYVYIYICGEIKLEVGSYLYIVKWNLVKLLIFVWVDNIIIVWE